MESAEEKNDGRHQMEWMRERKKNWKKKSENENIEHEE